MWLIQVISVSECYFNCYFLLFVCLLLLALPVVVVAVVVVVFVFGSLSRLTVVCYYAQGPLFD